MAGSRFAEPHYAELHCTTHFSLLQAASHPDELVEQASSLGYSALAITDRATLAGIVRAHSAAKRVGLKLLIGATLEPIEATPLVVWATSREGYSNLCRLLTKANRKGSDLRQHALTLDAIANHADGLLAGVPLGMLPEAGRLHGSHAAEDAERIVQAVVRWRELFGERLSCLAEVALEGDDAERLEWFAAVARQARVPIVASGDVRYHERARLPLFDLLAAVRHGCSVEQVRGRLRADERLSNGERHLQERWRIAERFASLPGAVERSLDIANQCTFSLDELRYEYPNAIVPESCTPHQYLAALTWKGARKRYTGGHSGSSVPDRVQQLIRHELSVVAELGYEAYFLTVFDIVRFARRRGILCQGRGSAANSAICYCLGITSVDPARMDVLFERFISRERHEAPDIDIDFEHRRREEVIQYVYKTYGRSRAAMTSEVISYRLRSAVRDVAKAMGFSLDVVHAIANTLDAGDGTEDLPLRLAEAGLDPGSHTAGRLISLVGQLIGFPRHVGQHVGGMVITRGDLCDLVPIQPAGPGARTQAEQGDGSSRTIVQWDKNDLNELGILKVDCLALGMLSAIRRAFDLILSSGGPKLTLASVPAEDPSVYEMISRADTVGVFQIESRAQRSMLPRLKPACFYDLVIEVALVRPGPIQGDMVHPYLRRRSGEEAVSYPNEAIRGVLEKTLGVPIFQEQAMRLAVVAAGFTAGEADQLRRAMGASRRPGVMDAFHKKLTDGMLARGLSPECAEQIFRQLCGFAEYGFPESHAASFALLVYVSAWLKRHHPAAFTAALLGNQPMGFYAPAQLVSDAKAHGVKVLPVDVNASQWHATLEQQSVHQGAAPACGLAIRLGLEQVFGLGEPAGLRIEKARSQGPFRLPHELARRARLGRESLLHLAKAGAIQSLGLDRRRAVWEAMKCLGRRDSRPLLESLDESLDAEEETIENASLPHMTRQEEVIADYQTGGLSLEAHPVEYERERLDGLGVLTVAEATQGLEGQRVKVAGIVLSRQRPSTAKGMLFLTVEDETGAANIVVRPDVWERAAADVRRTAVLLVHGRIQRRGCVVHIVATGLDVAALLDSMPRTSRDFC